MKTCSRRRCLQGLALSLVSPRLLAAEKQAVTPSPGEAAAMEAIVREVMEKQAIPGLSLAFAHAGQVVHTAALGWADREAAEPVTPAHRFRIASVSKPITSIAVHRLFEQGKLAPEDKVFGVEGRLPEFAVKGDDLRRLTLEHLLTHTGGGWGNKSNDPMFQQPAMTQAELIEWTLRTIPLENPPGAAYAYSNFGYCLLGRVIEAVTGESYEEYVRKQVLEPSGAQATRLAENGREGRQEREVVYYSQKDEDPYRPNINVKRMDAHGGWLATAEDLVRILVRVDGFPGAPDLLAADTVRAMTAPGVVNPGYARGWSVNKQPNWWHGGSLPGTSTLAVRTQSGLCWAVLANTRRRAPDQPDASTSAVLDRLMWRLARCVPAWG